MEYEAEIIHIKNNMKARETEHVNLKEKISEVYDDLLKKINNLEVKISSLEGKDTRDYDLLKTIQESINTLTKDFNSIKSSFNTKEVAHNTLKKVFYTIGSLLTAGAAAIGSIDALHHIGIG